MVRRVLIGALFALLVGAPAAHADLRSLEAACVHRYAGDGKRLPFTFCDDGVPAAGGTTPDPGAALALPGDIDNGQKLQCGRGHAAFAVALAQRELHHLVVEAALHAEPFVVQSAVRKDGGGQPERLDRFLDQHGSTG